MQDLINDPEFQRLWRERTSRQPPHVHSDMPVMQIEISDGRPPDENAEEPKTVQIIIDMM